MSDYNIDGDDVNTVIMMANPTTPLGFVIWLIVIVITLLIAYDNELDCSQKYCETGRPSVVDHNCMCIEKAQTRL